MTDQEKRVCQLLKSKSGLIITQFILYMQSESIGPCYLFIGDDPQELSGEEIIKLKNEFVAKMPGVSLDPINN